MNSYTILISPLLHCIIWVHFLQLTVIGSIFPPTRRTALYVKPGHLRAFAPHILHQGTERQCT
ncbi:hypothetical protein BDZ94DRAFT_1252443 [Collybia nuda]|uniref:Uncharacterized protein n=1 Tax=Collybia nuda TaxID=64659 RepID=A0A9P5YBY0_9AGAR|nr:hypothetical protein BDZ94DRAFT_1252443 [Collybia nuda]